MIYLNTLPYFKVFKRKAFIPIDAKSTTKNQLVFLCNNSYNSTFKIIDDKHPMITSNGKFKSYYMDRVYKIKLFNRTKNFNHTQERKTIYEDISNNTTISPYVTIDTVNNRNLYVDLGVYNYNFFSMIPSGSSPMKRIEAYINYLSGLVQDKRYDSYKTKMIFIDVNAWTGNDTALKTSSTKIENNPPLYFLYLVKKNPELFKKLGDIDIYLYTDDMILRMNPAKVDEKTFTVLKIQMQKMYKNISIPEDESGDEETDTTVTVDTSDNTEESKPVDNPRAEINKAKFTEPESEPTGSDDGEEEQEIPKEKPSEDYKTEDFLEYENEEESEDEEEKKPINYEEPNLIDDNDEELISSMNSIVTRERVTKSPEMIARNKVLKENQGKIAFNGKTIDDYIKKQPKPPIPVEDISSHITTTNKNVKKVKFNNFEKTYNENYMKKDTISIIAGLNNASIPVYIRDIKVEDSSDELNYKETYTVLLEDENRVRHTLTFDMPKFIDDKFIYLGGNKKIISKQIFSKPIIKTDPDTVQVCSNYNKIFMYRYGAKMGPELEKLKKTLGETFTGIKIAKGDNSSVNSKYVTIIDYDELAKSYYSITTKEVSIIFNQEEVQKKYTPKQGELCIGFYSNNKPIIVDIENETVEGMSLVPFIVSKLTSANSKFGALYGEVSSGAKKYMYTRAKIMDRFVPIVLLLGYCEGLTIVLKKAKVKYYFTDKRPSITDRQEYIQFADGYLVYDRYPFENSLLLNGLMYVPTKAYNYADFDETEAYVELFDSMFNARKLANAFDMFYDFMIDSITKEVLEDMKYPTDFVSVILLANSMLADNSYMLETDMHSYRIRSNEIVNAILHKEISNAYFKYKLTANNKNSTKISIRKDAVLKTLVSLPTVEDYSTLNPIFEVKKLRNASLKGLSGMNLEQAFTLDKRGYDKSMVGLFGVSSSTDANVGVVRQMSLEPNVEGPRGYIHVEDDVDKVKDVNLFTPAELLTPMGVTRDDGPRVSMASVQSTHIVPIKKSSPVLISNGTEQSLPYYLSSDFIIRAEDDGEIIEVDEKTGIIIAKYKNGNVRAIDTKSRMAKNSSSGFYVDNKLRCDLKVGDKFKKQDILAYENRFFTDDKMNGTRFNIGALEKVAIMSGYFTIDDSACVTRKITEDMTTNVIMMKDATLGANANVDYIVKVGDTVEVGDTLISFETSYDDSSINKFLASVGDELGEDIKSLNRVPIKSKYSGVISDIKIYSTVELDEMSPSLRKIVSAYYANINARKKQLNKYDNSKSIIKAGILLNEGTGKVQPGPDGKIKGHEVFDGVLFEFYIKYNDVLGVGDKLTYFSALKSVICEVIDEGYEAYTDFRPDEEISTFVGPSAILARMVPSTINTILGNKIVVELKRKLKEIYDK